MQPEAVKAEDDLTIPAFLDHRKTEAQREAALRKVLKQAGKTGTPALARETAPEIVDDWPVDPDVLEEVMEMGRERGYRGPIALLFTDRGTRALIEEKVRARVEKKAASEAAKKVRSEKLRDERKTAMGDRVSLRQIVTELSEGRAARVKRRWAMAALTSAGRKHESWVYAKEQAEEVRGVLRGLLDKAPAGAAGRPAEKPGAKVPGGRRRAKDVPRAMGPPGIAQPAPASERAAPQPARGRAGSRAAGRKPAGQGETSQGKPAGAVRRSRGERAAIARVQAEKPAKVRRVRRKR